MDSQTLWAPDTPHGQVCYDVWQGMIANKLTLVLMDYFQTCIFNKKSICYRLLSMVFCYFKISCLPTVKAAHDVSQLKNKSLSHSAREKYTAVFRIVKALIGAKVAKSVYIENISLEVIH